MGDPQPSPAASSSTSAFSSSIHAFLDSQSQFTMDRLYSTPAGALAIFRSVPVLSGPESPPLVILYNEQLRTRRPRLLPPLARQVVLTLLWLESSMRKDDLLVWIRGADQPGQ